MPSKTINADGKTYTFTPGPNGSLTTNEKVVQKPIYTPRPSVAKTIGPCKNCGSDMADTDVSCKTCGSDQGSSYSKALIKARPVSASAQIGAVRG